MKTQYSRNKKISMISDIESKIFIVPQGSNLTLSTQINLTLSN